MFKIVIKGKGNYELGHDNVHISNVLKMKVAGVLSLSLTVSL
jgi:hypothetical protein